MKEMLRRVGRKGAVLAFEPLPDLCKKLRKKYGRRHNVGIYQNALSNESKVVKFFRDRQSGGSSLRSDMVKEITDIILVSTTTLDEMDKQVMWLKQLDFVKIDVQYMELKVLEGMKGLIDRFHPTIIAECTEGSEDEGLMLMFFHIHGYDTIRFKDDILAQRKPLQAYS
jgi:FkbM family methyltransferase